MNGLMIGLSEIARRKLLTLRVFTYLTQLNCLKIYFIYKNIKDSQHLWQWVDLAGDQ